MTAPHDNIESHHMTLYLLVFKDQQVFILYIAHTPSNILLSMIQTNPAGVNIDTRLSNSLPLPLYTLTSRGISRPFKLNSTSFQEASSLCDRCGWFIIIGTKGRIYLVSMI